MAVSGLCGMRGGFASGVLGGFGHGRIGLGNDGGTADKPHFFPVLEGSGLDKGAVCAAGKKIFAFFENFICIWGKMGYNMEEWLSNASAAGRR